MTFKAADMDQKATQKLLDELQKVVDTLKASLPKEAPIAISKSIDPARCLCLREACYHRVAELTGSACDEFKKGSLVAGYLLARAVYETVALFWYFVDQVSDSLKSGDTEELRVILTRMMVGARVESVKENVAKALDKAKDEIGKTLDPMSVPKLIKHVAKKLPPFEDHYNFLCEVAHPNAMGLMKAYVRNDWENAVTYFGKERGSFGSHLGMDLEAFIVILEAFVNLYAESDELLRTYAELAKSGRV